MPLIIPKTLPAYDALYNENIFVMHRERALAQHIRPLEILILNLMPTKIATETQIARLLANTPLQVHMTLLQTMSHEATHVSAAHLEAFYKTFDEVKHNRYDGMIITGAPVETMDFEQVDYWPELCEIMDFSETNVYSTLHVCWGAQAGLYYHYGVRKHILPEKIAVCGFSAGGHLALSGAVLAVPGLPPWRALVFGTLGIWLASASAAAFNHLIDERIDKLMARTARRTVPQIFIGETHVGGCDDLIALDQRGGLLPLLAGQA